MLRYAAGRLVQAAVAILGVLTIVFIVMRFSGDPTLLLVPEGASQEAVDALRKGLGFDRPIIVQYVQYLSDLASFNFGISRSRSTSQHRQSRARSSRSNCGCCSRTARSTAPNGARWCCCWQGC